jgi:hypothetical protein
MRWAFHLIRGRSEVARVLAEAGLASPFVRYRSSEVQAPTFLNTHTSTCSSHHAARCVYATSTLEEAYSSFSDTDSYRHEPSRSPSLQCSPRPAACFFQLEGHNALFDT